MATLTATDKSSLNTGWDTRHNAALKAIPVRPFESAMVQMMRAWEQYARDHKATYETAIGDDGVLGPEWEDIGDSLRGLLNGQTGRLDCGTCDSFILETMRENGIDTETK